MQWKQIDTRPAPERSMQAKVLKEGSYECAFCGGSGVRGGGLTCQACNGRKVHEIEGVVIKCSFCKGTGRQVHGVGLTCYVCKGSGWVGIQEPIDVCRHCRGSGAEPSSKLPCIVCSGKGYVTIKD